MPYKTGEMKGELTTAEIRKLIRMHNKLTDIKIPKGSKREDIMKLLDKHGYKVNHEKGALVPKVAMQRKKTIKLKDKEKVLGKEKTKEEKEKSKQERESKKKKKEGELIKKGAVIGKLLAKKKGKVPKGSHRMPDGSIMKDSKMKGKSISTQTEPQKEEPKKAAPKKAEPQEKTKLTDEEDKELTKWAKTHGFVISKSRKGGIVIKIKKKDERRTLWTADDLKVVKKFVLNEAPKLKLKSVQGYYHRQRESRMGGTEYSQIYEQGKGLVNKEWFVFKDMDTIKKEKEALVQNEAKNRAKNKERNKK